MEGIHILESLRSLIPPLNTEEREQLEKNIIAEGKVLDPIIIWKGEGAIVDGMNRFEIAVENDIPFEVEEKEFADINAVRKWIIENQMGRRNLDSIGMSIVRGQYAAMLKASGVKFSSEAASKNFGVDKRTIYRDKHNAEAFKDVTEPVKKKIMSGEIDASSADIKRFAALSDIDKKKATDLVKYSADKDGTQAFDSLGEVIDALTHKKKDTPPDVRLEKIDSQITGMIEKMARLFDERNHVTGDKDACELCQSALKHLGSTFKDWTQPKSDRFFR